MQTKLEFAKQSPKQLKEILSDPTQKHNHWGCLVRLGDIAKNSNQFENAQRHYLKANKLNKSVIVYIRLATLFECNQKTDLADLMYIDALKLCPNHDHCTFLYAKFKSKHSKHAEAQPLYLQCMKNNPNRACVNYQLALCYTKQNPHDDDDRIHQLYRRAIELKPSITQYHYHYALYLKAIRKYNRAKYHLKKALDLVQNNDAFILHHYWRLLSNCLDDKENALQYLECAAALAMNNPDPKATQIVKEYQYIATQSSTTTTSTDSNHAPHIALVCFEFESMITYRDLVGVGDVKSIARMKQTDIIALFGGEDRLDYLHTHFRQILSVPHDIRIAALSLRVNTAVMEETLKRVDLMQYFVKTISSSSKLEAVIDLMDEYQIFSSQGVLFLDHDETNINQVKDHIPITYHIPKVWCNLRGPTFEDFELIESIIGTQTADCASKPQLAEEESKESLSEMESDLYEDIKKKIMAAPHQSINDMDCVQWIYSNWGMYPSRRDLFIYFAETFQQIIVSTSNPKHGAWWSACLLLQKLLKYESKDCELYGWLANGLSHLNHVDSADLYYKLAFEHGGDAVDTIVKDYAFSLLRWRRYKEAEISFKKCMEMKEDGKRDRTLCYGLARVLSYLKKNDEAEMYFRLGMKEGRFYEVIHSSYARFLGRQRRYEESKKEYELCIKHKPNDAMLHYSLCGVLKQMKKMKGYEHHLNKALQLDPHLLQASREWTRYYRQPYAAANKQNRKEKEAVVVNRYVVEFDRFWFDCIGDGVDKRCKDRYYMEFKRCKMNDIRCIARNKKMESDLMNRIGVSQAHVVVMMDAIRLFRSKVNVFTEWMKTHKLGEAFGDIFEKNAIFTLESLSRLGYTKFEALAQQNRAKHINYERSIKRLWDTYMLTKHHMNNRYQKTNR